MDLYKLKLHNKTNQIRALKFYGHAISQIVLRKGKNSSKYFERSSFIP